jgi:hypothetical protein
MTGMERRLRRLEERFRGPVESELARRVTARLEAARRRYGVPPPPAERLAQIRGMSIVEILHAGRRRTHANSCLAAACPAIL